MRKQFEDVSSKYGAPMGRSSYGTPPEKGIRLFKVNLDSGGYDDGGAYWGFPCDLYCAQAPDTSENMADESNDYRAFTRADSRREAMEKLGLIPSQLVSKSGL